MDGTNTFAGKLVGLFASMDRIIGGRYEKGLATLEQVARAAAGGSAAATAAPKST
jgi:hypothetical protein